MQAAGCSGLSEAVRQILHENYTGLLSVFEEMGTIKRKGIRKGLPTASIRGESPRNGNGVFMDRISTKNGNRTSETAGPDASFYRTAAVCLAVYLILALAGACAIAAERMGWETPPGEYYEMETDMSEFEGPLEEIGRIR